MAIASCLGLSEKRSVCSENIKVKRKKRNTFSLNLLLKASVV